MKLAKIHFVLAVALAGCDPYLSAQSPAPPGRSAMLEAVEGFWSQVKYYKVEVTQGVALAVSCNYGGPCKNMHVTSTDPAIADVRLATLSMLERNALTGQALGAPSAFVIVGKKPGEARLHMTTADGSRDVVVTVIAPPTPGSSATRAH